MVRIFVKTTVLLAVAITLLVGGYWLWSGNQPVNQGSPQFVVAPGDSVSRIARNLVAKGIISEPYSFILWSYQRGYTGSLKTGEYRIPPRTTLLGLLEQLFRGRVITYSVTFIEGWTFKEFLSELATQDKLQRTIGKLSHDEVMAMLGHPGLHPEGRFFPDTYVFDINTTDIDVLRQAFSRMKLILEREWAARGPDIGLENVDDALTLASIIEKETGRPEERATIAGVFHNRLNRNMRLQTDPTVIYGLGDEFTGDLKRKHLRQDTPYNTYTRAGLPPTPIANPGEESIKAALHPADTDALYFVSKGDGSHQFSETLDAHNKAVIQYQLGGRQKSFSSHSDSE